MIPTSLSNKTLPGGRGYQIIGALMLCIAAIAFSAQTIIIKYARPLLTVWQISFARWFFGALCMIMISLIFRINILGHNRLGLTLRGLASTVGFILLVKSIQLLPVSLATVLFHTFPLWSALLSPIINRELISKKDWVLIAGAFAGTCLTMLTSFDSLYSLWSGKFLALGSGFCIGLSQNLVRRFRQIIPHDNTFSIFFYFCITGSLFTIGPLLFQKAPLMPVYPGTLFIILLAALAILAQLSVGIGFKYINAPKGGVIQMLQLVLVGFYGVIVFGEPMTLRLLTGFALIIGCCIGLTLRK